MSEKRYGYRTVVFDALLAGTPKRIMEVVYRWRRKEPHVASVHIEEPPKSGTVTFLFIQLRLNDDRDQIGISHQYAGTVNINGEELGSHVEVSFFDWESADDRSDAYSMSRINDYATLPNQGKIFEQLVQALRREVLVLQDNLKVMANENTEQDATPESGKVESGDKLQADWDKMSPKTKKNFRESWKIWNRMRKAYRLEKLDGQTEETQPKIKDWQTKVMQDLHWDISESRLRDVKKMGESKIIK